MLQHFTQHGKWNTLHGGQSRSVTSTFFADMPAARSSSSEDDEDEGGTDDCSGSGSGSGSGGSGGSGTVEVWALKVCTSNRVITAEKVAAGAKDRLRHQDIIQPGTPLVIVASTRFDPRNPTNFADHVRFGVVPRGGSG
jgi:hypothetical protein